MVDFPPFKFTTFYAKSTYPNDFKSLTCYYSPLFHGGTMLLNAASF